MDGLQKRTVEGTDKVQQLEASLLMCREEIKVHLLKIEQSKEEQDQELFNKDQQVKRE